MERGKWRKAGAAVVVLVLAVCLGVCRADVNDPIAYWMLDEDTGPVAYDSAGTYHGIVHGALWTTGVLDGALSFDGIDDYVELPDNNPVWLPQNDFALSLWVYLEREPGIIGEIILDLNAGASSDPDNRLGYAISMLIANAGRAEFGMYTTNSVESLVTDTVLAKDRWYHIAAVRNGTTQSIYVNGQLDGVRTCSSDPIDFVGGYDDDKVNIGRYTTSAGAPAYHLAGKIDDVRIYDRALPAEEVEAIYSPGSGLVAHWKFDEGTGATAYDSAGDNDGAIYGAQWTTGLLDGALYFDGVDDYVDCGNDNSLDITGSISLSAWAKLDSLPRYLGIVNKRGAEYNDASNYALRTGRIGFGENDELEFYYSDGIDWQIYTTSNANLVAGRWYHIAVTYTFGAGTSIKFYLDNDLLDGGWTMGNGNAAVQANAQPVTIGGLIDGESADGKIDDVRIYSRALSAPEIEALYEIGVPDINGPAGIYYVDGINGSDLNDGLSLGTAFATIQKGINTAQDGNAVLVYPAIYAEALNLHGKAIAVEGVATQAGIPIIEAPGDFVVSCYAGEGTDTVLEHLVIRDSEMAIFLADASPTLRYLTVVDNSFGIGAYGDSAPNISNCIFFNNIDGDLHQCEAQHSWFGDANEPNAPTTGLVSHWALDEGEGTIAYDSAGANHGTLVNGPAWEIGKLDDALDFDGIDDHVRVPDAPSLTFSQYDSFSISYWARPVSGDDDNIIGKFRSAGQSGIFGYRSGWHGGLEAFRFTAEKSGSGATDVWTANNSAPVGSWYLVTCVYSDANMTIYLNGNYSDSATFAYDTGVTAPDNDLLIGARLADSIIDKYFNGIVDEVRVYGRALSVQEVGQLYQAALGGQGSSGPLFADAGGGDYHLKSERGRYWAAHDVWVLDDVSSPCVDIGDPLVEPSDEPMPNGGRINIGAYGNTPYASMSEWPIREDNNQDGIVNMLDVAMLANKWLQMLDWAQ